MSRFRPYKTNYCKNILFFLTLSLNIGIILKLSIFYDPLAQTVEHLTFNQGVRGSNPRWVTKRKVTHRVAFLFCSIHFYLK